MMVKVQEQMQKFTLRLLAVLQTVVYTCFRAGRKIASIGVKWIGSHW